MILIQNNGITLIREVWRLDCYGTSVPSNLSRFYVENPLSEVPLLLPQLFDICNFYYFLFGKTSAAQVPLTPILSLPLPLDLLMVSVDVLGSSFAGEQQIFACVVTGGAGSTSGITYRWFKDGAVIRNEIEPRLHFNTVNETQSGEYACEGTRSSISVLSESVTFNVTGKL